MEAEAHYAVTLRGSDGAVLQSPCGRKLSLVHVDGGWRLCHFASTASDGEPGEWTEGDTGGWWRPLPYIFDSAPSVDTPAFQRWITDIAAAIELSKHTSPAMPDESIQ